MTLWQSWPSMNMRKERKAQLALVKQIGSKKMILLHLYVGQEVQIKRQIAKYRAICTTQKFQKHTDFPSLIRRKKQAILQMGEIMFLHMSLSFLKKSSLAKKNMYIHFLALWQISGDMQRFLSTFHVLERARIFLIFYLGG